MPTIDIIFIFLIAFGTATGFFFGLIRVIGAILTIIVSILIAGAFFEELMPSLQPYLLDNENLARVVSFLLIYWISSLFLSFLVKIVNKIFNLPILKVVNRMLGGLVSLIGSIAILSIFIFLFDKYAWVESLHQLIRESNIGIVLIEIGEYVSLVIPGL